MATHARRLKVSKMDNTLAALQDFVFAALLVTLFLVFVLAAIQEMVDPQIPHLFHPL